MTGLFGKMPRHGDFVRLGLPAEFVTAWDEWASRAIASARAALPPEAWDACWAAAPPWRFRLAPSVCGPWLWAGVVALSEDMVGRRFPLVVASSLVDHDPPPEPWYDATEAALAEARGGGLDAEGLLAALPPPPLPLASDSTFDGMCLWWRAGQGARAISRGLTDSPVFAWATESAA
jgi:type VI secretion system protein ImpM